MKLKLLLFHKWLLLVSIPIFLTYSCEYKNEEDLFGLDTNSFNCLEGGKEISYQTEILPILDTYCYECHRLRSSRGGVILEGYQRTKFWVDNGYLAGALNHQAGFSPMPPGTNKIPLCELTKINEWIDQGAMEN